MPMSGDHKYGKTTLETQGAFVCPSEPWQGVGHGKNQ
jgi:hypothetical protein